MKNGFTLVELLAIIIILGIISLIVVPTITNQIELSKEKAYDKTVNSIEEAARRYGIKNNLGYSTTEQTLALSTLVEAGFLDEKKLINPKTEEKMTGCVYYKWNDVNNVYEYDYEPNC